MTYAPGARNPCATTESEDGELPHCKSVMVNMFRTTFRLKHAQTEEGIGKYGVNG